MMTGDPCSSSRANASRQSRQYTSRGTKTSKSRLGTRTERHPRAPPLFPAGPRNGKRTRRLG
eukprot:1106136-Heterocapsa_arctica.AAC.1